MAFIGILLMTLGTAIIVLLGIQGLTIQETIAQLGTIFGVPGGGSSFSQPGQEYGGPSNQT